MNNLYWFLYGIQVIQFYKIMLQSNYSVLVTGGVWPVCLPSEGESFLPGADCWITGWGYVQEGGGSFY